MSKKKRPISPIAKAFILLGINILDTAAVKHIPIEEIRSAVRLLLEPLKETIRVLADADPENDKQLQELWLNFLRSEEFNQTTEARILQAIALIEDEAARDFVTKLAKPCLATTKCLYDVDPDNLNQIRIIWTEFLTEKENIKAGLAFFIKDESLLEDLSLIIDNIHDTVAAVIEGSIAG